MEVQGGGDICIPMADSWQKTTQQCKSISLQIKINLNIKNMPTVSKIPVPHMQTTCAMCQK